MRCTGPIFIIIELDSDINLGTLATKLLVWYLMLSCTKSKYTVHATFSCLWYIYRFCLFFVSTSWWEALLATVQSRRLKILRVLTPLRLNKILSRFSSSIGPRKEPVVLIMTRIRGCYGNNAKPLKTSLEPVCDCVSCASTLQDSLRLCHDETKLD